MPAHLSAAEASAPSVATAHSAALENLIPSGMSAAATGEPPKPEAPMVNCGISASPPASE